MVKFTDFTMKENEISVQTEQYFSKEIEFFKKNFDIACEIYDWFYKKHDKPENPIPKKLFPLSVMIPRLLFTLKAIYNLTTIGYYYDAHLLFRTFIENLGLCIYLTKNENHVTKWLQGKKMDVPYIELFRETFSVISGDLNKKN